MRMAFVAAAVLAGVSARADVRGTLVPELRLSAGYDDNLFLDANPSGVLPSQIRADAIFDVEPALLAALSTGGHTLSLEARFLERATLSNLDLRDFTQRLEWRSRAVGPPSRAVRFSLGGLYEHYETALFPSDTFDLGGGEAGVRVLAGERIRFDARYRADARAYSDPSRNGQLDVDQRASAGLHARLHPLLDGDVGFTYLHIGSSVVTADLDRYRGDIGLTLKPASWLAIAVGYGLAGQHLPLGMHADGTVGPRDDLLHELTANVVARPLRWLELFARYDRLISTSSDLVGTYDRNQVQVGLSLAWDFTHRWTQSPAQAPHVDGTRVTFRFRGTATGVSVVGDWNGWDTAAQRLVRRGDVFEGTYLLPPGRHEYALSVDGVVRPPPDAPAYVDDGFGGRNGVLEVR
jgi:hypothetical protein